MRPVSRVVLAARSESAVRIHGSEQILMHQIDAGIENRHTNAGAV